MANKYIFKDFYNKTNKKEYNLQIWQYNICYTNLIAIKIMIAIAKRGEANKELLTIENTNKITIVENAKVSNIIDFNSKYY